MESLSQRFVLGPLVGSGGSAEVFRATDLHTGRDVAFKRLRAGPDDAIARARFEREARILATLDSPHVVAYVAHGVDDEGRLCLVTEWLQGETVDEALERARPNDWTALRIVYESALGLSALHEVGVVHRDVKPANLFLASTGDGVAVRVIDLGIAIGEEDLGVTATGIVVGSPVYIAPERLAGHAPSSASDVYSLAVVFFELLTGIRPFESDRTGETLRRIVGDAPPRLRSLRPDLPAELDALVSRALAKDPAARPSTALEFADQATSILSLVTTQPDGVPEATVLGRVELRVRSFVSVRFSPDADPSRAAAVEASFRRRGARVDRLGDVVWGIFGEPRLLGDEPRRAVRAALRARGDDAVAVVTTGLLRVGALGPEGPAVRRAERIATEVPAGAVVTDDATAVMLGDAYDVVSEGPRAWVRGPRSDRGRVAREDVPPGRAREHDLVCGVVADAWAAPAPTLVVVWGDPGIGKSRLGRAVASTLAEAAGTDAPHPLLTIRGDAAASTTPSGALGRALRELAGVQDGASLREQRARLDAAFGAWVDDASVGALAELTRVRSDVSEMIELPPREPVAMGDGGPRAVVELLRAACADAPRLVVLEDLHWLDEASLELVARAVDALAGLPLAVLALGRPEAPRDAPRAAGLVGPRAHRAPPRTAAALGVPQRRARRARPRREPRAPRRHRRARRGQPPLPRRALARRRGRAARAARGRAGARAPRGGAVGGAAPPRRPRPRGAPRCARRERLRDGLLAQGPRGRARIDPLDPRRPRARRAHAPRLRRPAPELARGAHLGVGLSPRCRARRGLCDPPG
ncbi:MAG: protein kinase [Polyangiales bacterium]